MVHSCHRADLAISCATLSLHLIQASIDPNCHDLLGRQRYTIALLCLVTKDLILRAVTTDDGVVTA